MLNPEYQPESELKQDSLLSRYDRFLEAVRLETEELGRLVRRDSSVQLERLPPGIEARVGLEMEMQIISTCNGTPLHKNDEVLESIKCAQSSAGGADDEAWTHELGRSQIEVRSGVGEFPHASLVKLEQELQQRISEANRAAAAHGGRIAPSGHLPSIAKSDLLPENLSRKADRRYERANELACSLLPKNSENVDSPAFPVRIAKRGSPNDVAVEFAPDSIITAGTICSLQPHLQVDATRFVELFNIAQMISGYVLAPAANSPLVLGTAGWKESRIQLFHQAWDPKRVFFGESYIKDAADPFRENLERGIVPMFTEVAEPRVDEAGYPGLTNLQRHNGTIHRWNRAIVGFHNGSMHLRVEHRGLPVAAAPRDNVANAAFFWGLARGYLDVLEKDPSCTIQALLSFEKAKANFYAAAEHGLEAKLYFPGVEGAHTMAEKGDELLKVAHAGLGALGVAAEEVERYLGVIRCRIKSGKTEADWIQALVKNADSAAKPEEVHRAVAIAIAECSAWNITVHERTDSLKDYVREWRA